MISAPLSSQFYHRLARKPVWENAKSLSPPKLPMVRSKCQSPSFPVSDFKRRKQGNWAFSLSWEYEEGTHCTFLMALCFEQPRQDYKSWPSDGFCLCTLDMLLTQTVFKTSLQPNFGVIVLKGSLLTAVAEVFWLNKSCSLSTLSQQESFHYVRQVLRLPPPVAKHYQKQVKGIVTEPPNWVHSPSTQKAKHWHDIGMVEENQSLLQCKGNEPGI